MKCKSITKMLAAYLGDELTAARQRQVENHLKYCMFCRMELSALKKTDKMLDSWKDVEPRKDIAAEVMLQIKKEQYETSAIQRIWQFLDTRKYKFARAVGALLILAAVFLGVNRNQNPGTGVKHGAISPMIPNLSGNVGTFQPERVIYPTPPGNTTVSTERILLVPKNDMISSSLELSDLLRQYYKPASPSAVPVVHNFYDYKNATIEIRIQPQGQ